MAAAKKNAWHAVTIVPGAVACAAAQELRGRRFLALTAPRLPLAGCTNQDHCRCRYQHHADRRGNPRREPAGAGKPAQPPDKERRRPGERRERRS